ncbi:hypothetical protein [Candidatus Marithrix sp. Canyon 246]|uniref:hypothetical protein n=1 Tax=Candidatus Marithrix sp. Canyon 246 TaxID=1827136 RepID=UPI00084A1059|nr:hypothetical protein [Candidatus Marithrix sp. Canyon 246]
MVWNETEEKSLLNELNKKIMNNKLIISTIGTSLLTNQINRANPDEKTWYSQLRDAANFSEAETPIETN